MLLEALLKKLVKELRPYAEHYALCGGLAASLYRSSPRVTNDIDFALDFEGTESSKKAAKSVLKSVGLTPSMGWIAGAGERLTSVAPLVIGRKKDAELFGTVDFLLPIFPWVTEAVRRAQFNVVDFGSVKIPVITPEDLVIAKLFALEVEPNRFADLDDLQSMFKSKIQFDEPYLVAELNRLDVSVPLELEKSAPSSLKRLRKRR